MAVKTSIIAAVAVLETVDMTAVKMIAPAEYTHATQKIEFDRYNAGIEIASKGSFDAQAGVVGKDGFQTVTVNPMQINESITDGTVNVGKKRIGETVYGDKKGITAGLQRTVENEMKGFGKLKLRAERLIKKTVYDVAVTGKVIVSADGVPTDEIDYGLTNKVVNDNATAGQFQWNDTTNSNPIEQLERYALSMGKFAVNTFILGFEAHKAFVKHPKVQTSDNTTTGKKANFVNATPAESAAKSTDTFIFVGTTAGDYGKVLEIYVELDQYNNGTSDVYYMDKNYAVGFRRNNEENAQRHYGLIPVAQGEGENVEIVGFEGKEWIDGETKKDPVGIKRYYKSSPLVTMNQPKAFVSIKATLIA